MTSPGEPHAYKQSKENHKSQSPPVSGFATSPLVPMTRTPALPELEPMQVGHARLSPEERQHHRDSNFCIYCDNTGHYLLRCLFWGERERPPMKREILVGTLALSSPCRLLLPTITNTNHNDLAMSALVDSGSEQNLISMNLVKIYTFPTLEISRFNCWYQWRNFGSRSS